MNTDHMQEQPLFLEDRVAQSKEHGQPACNHRSSPTARQSPRACQKKKIYFSTTEKFRSMSGTPHSTAGYRLARAVPPPIPPAPDRSALPSLFFIASSLTISYIITDQSGL